MDVIDFGQIDATEGAGGDLVLEQIEQRVPPQHKADDRLDCGLTDRVVHGAKRREVECRGFLDQDVLAGSGRGDGVVGMQIVRRADGEDLHIVACQHRRQIGGDERAIEAGGLRDGACGCLPTARHRHHAGTAIGLPGGDVRSGDPARAVHRDSVAAHEYGPRALRGVAILRAGGRGYLTAARLPQRRGSTCVRRMGANPTGGAGGVVPGSSRTIPRGHAAQAGRRVHHRPRRTSP